MSGGDLVLYNDPLEGDTIPKALELAKTLATTEFVPSALRNKPAAVLAAILTGREIGVGPMASLAKIHIIDGRPAPAAEMMRALVLSHGHEVWFEEITNTRVTICGQRRGSERVTTVMWTLDDAKRANLDGKQNWKRYPRAMLEARATGELCRMIFADVLGGISYNREEMEDGIIDVDSEELVGGADAGEKQITRKAAPPRKAAAKKAAAAARQAPPLPSLPGEGDDEVVEAEIVEDPQAVERATQIAMRARDAGVDHHHVVSAVTNGVKTSAKTVTPDEAGEVMTALRDLANGRRLLVEGDDGGWVLIDATDAADGAEEAGEPEVGDEDLWTDDQWRSFLNRKGVSVPNLLREASRLARSAPDDFGEPPTNLAGLHGKKSLCSLLRGWVEDEAGDQDSML